MNKELDLSGLKAVYGGLILQIVSVLFLGRLTSGLMSGAAAAGIVSPVINIIALCIILGGVSKLNGASPFFTKAKKPFLVQLVVQAVLILILAVLGSRGWSVDMITQSARSSVLEMLFLVLAVLVVLIISTLISVRALLRGCGHVAEQVNDPLFSIKCMKTWRLWNMTYLLTILMILASVAVIITVLRKTIESGSAGEDLSQAIFTNVSSSVLLVSIIMLVVLIFFLIVHIIFLGKIRLTYREYHLEEVKAAPKEVGRPVLADYVQRELDGVYDQDSAADDFGEDSGKETGVPDVYEEEYPEAQDLKEEPETVPEETEKEEDEERTISGRKYRRVADSSEEEEEQDPNEIFEIAKLFHKKK